VNVVRPFRVVRPFMVRRLVWTILATYFFYKLLLIFCTSSEGVEISITILEHILLIWLYYCFATSEYYSMDPEVKY